MRLRRPPPGVRRLPLSGGGGHAGGDFVGDLLELGGVVRGDGYLAVEELGGRTLDAVVIDRFVNDERGEIVALSIGVVMIGGIEVDGGIFSRLAGEGSADEGDPGGTIGVFRGEIVAQRGIGTMEVAQHFLRAGKALGVIEGASGTRPRFEKENAGAGRSLGDPLGEGLAINEELLDVSDVGRAEAVVLEDDPIPSFLERLVGRGHGHEVRPVFASGGDGAGSDLATLGGSDFLDELGDAAVFFDSRHRGAESKAVAEKEDIIRLSG